MRNRQKRAVAVKRSSKPITFQPHQRCGNCAINLSRSCQLWLDNSPEPQGGFDDSWAKAAAYFPVQHFCSLDNRHVDRTSDTRARRPARLHLELGRSALPLELPFYFKVGSGAEKLEELSVQKEVESPKSPLRRSA
jgi:hypothetical protein